MAYQSVRMTFWELEVFNSVSWNGIKDIFLDYLPRLIKVTSRIDSYGRRLHYYRSLSKFYLGTSFMENIFNVSALLDDLTVDSVVKHTKNVELDEN